MAYDILINAHLLSISLINFVCLLFATNLSLSYITLRSSCTLPEIRACYTNIRKITAKHASCLSGTEPT